MPEPVPFLTGLGLAIAKELAEELSGGSAVTSRKGVMEFAVRLPMG